MEATFVSKTISLTIWVKRLLFCIVDGIMGSSLGKIRAKRGLIDVDHDFV